MTSLDLDKITSPPILDPSQYNQFITPEGRKVSAYYSPLNKGWVAIYYSVDSGDSRGAQYHMPGIDATDWPEVWAEIISKEHGS